MNKPTKPGSKSTNLPDLYRLLGIEPLENDRERIEVAVTALSTQAQEASPAHPQFAHRANKIVKLVQANLLSDRKAAYDRQWRAHYGESATGAASDEPLRTVPNSSALDRLLPAGDPLQAFDLGRFLESAPDEAYASPSTQEFEELCQFVAEDRKSEAGPDAGPERAESRAQASQEGQSQPVASRAGASLVRARPLAAGGRTPVKSAGALAKQLRRKRERSILLSAAGILVSLAVVLAILFFALERDTASQSTASSAPPASAVDPPGTAAATESAPRGSGLPRVTGLEDGADLRPVIDVATLPPIQRQPAAAEETNQAADGAAASGDVGERPIPATSGVNSSQSTASESAAAGRAELSDEEKRAWTAQMLDIRRLLSAYAYADATSRLSAAAEVATLPVQRSQLSRLSETARLAQEAHAALVAAVTGLSAAETFRVGTSAEVSFVEGSDSHIVIKLLGKREAYSYQEIPIGMVYALLDLKLDLIHPSTAARKAAFTLFQPNMTQRSLTKAKELLSEAEAAGIVPEDTVAVFEDDYQL